LTPRPPPLPATDDASRRVSQSGTSFTTDTFAQSLPHEPLLHGFAFSNKNVRSELVKEAMVSVGEIVVREQLELANKEGYRNFGQVLFGKTAKRRSPGSPKKGSSRATSSRRGRQASASSRSSSQSDEPSSLGSSGRPRSARRTMFIDNVQIQRTVERACDAVVNQQHVKNVKHPNHHKAVTVHAALVSSVELQDCIQDSVELSLMALTSHLSDDALRIPLPASLRCTGGSLSGENTPLASPKASSMADVALETERERREKALEVRTHPTQAACDRRGLWYSMLQPEAPVPPMHVRLPTLFAAAVAAPERTHLLSLGEPRLDRSSRMRDKLQVLSDAYVTFLWSIESSSYRDDIVGCVPQLVARATREIIETKRTQAIAAELVAKHLRARRMRERQFRMSLSLGASALLSSDDGAASGNSPDHDSDDDKDQMHVQQMSQGQRKFDEAIATLFRDIIWMFGGIDKRANFAEDAWIKCGAAHSLEVNDDPTAPEIETNEVLVRRAALASAVTHPSNMHDVARIAPVFPWQLCSDGATSNREFRKRMLAKLALCRKQKTAVAQAVAEPTSPTNAQSSTQPTFENAPASVEDSRRARHQEAKVRRARAFAGLDPSLQPRQLKHDLAVIRTAMNLDEPESSSAQQTKLNGAATMSVTARIVGKKQAETIERMRTAMNNAMPRPRGPTDIGLPNARMIVAEDRRKGTGQSAWYEHGRRYGTAFQQSDAPYGFFDLNSVTPLVAMQSARNAPASGAPQPPQSLLPHPPLQMRWML
jgi:hypothetical protein